MQGIATAQEFFQSHRPQQFPAAVPPSSAARAYGGTQSGTTPRQQAAFSAHHQATQLLDQTLRLHRQGRFLEAEHERGRAVAMIGLLRRSVNLGSSALADQLYRIYDYLLRRLDEESLASTDATEMACESMRVLSEAWAARCKQSKVFSLIGTRARVGAL